MDLKHKQELMRERQESQHEQQEFNELYSGKELICPYCRKNSTTFNKVTGELKPCLLCHKKRLSLYQAKNSGRYELSLHEYHNILREQENKCAICGIQLGESTDNKLSRPHVDHCHDLQHVRGITCGNCNAGLGFFMDDPDILRNAFKYLTSNKFKRNWSINKD